MANGSSGRDDARLARRSPAARAIRWLAVLLLFLVVGVLFAPTLLTRRWIYQPLVDRFAKIDHRLRIDAISAGWSTPLGATGITLQQPDGEVLLRIAEVRSSLTLLDLIFTDGNLQTITVERPEVHVRLLEDGNNIQRFAAAIDGRTRQRAAGRAPAVNATLDVQDLMIRVDDAREQTRLLETSPSNFQLQYLAAEDVRRVEIAPTRIVDHLQLTPQLLEIGLQLALPAFYKATAVDGEISIDLDRCTIPLDDPMNSQIAGTIWLHEVAASARAPMLQKTVEVAGVLTRRQLASRLVVAADSEVPFSVSERRVHHEGLRFGVPRIDERLQFETEGWVDFEQQTEMTLTLPVPVEMLARRGAVRAMGVPTVVVRVTGSLDQPQVDLPATGMQLLEIAGEILRRQRSDGEDDPPPSILGGIDPTAELAREGAEVIGGVLQRALDRRDRERQDRERQQSEAAEEETADGETAPRRRGLLRRLLRRPQSSDEADEVDPPGPAEG